MAADPAVAKITGSMMKQIMPYLIGVIVIGGILEIIIDCFNKKVDKFGDSLRNKLNKSKVDKCPYCGGRLIEKSGQYGKFYGCSNYPRCKFTKKIN
jgi:hypothetical protein